VRGEQNLIPGWILLVEAWGDEAPFVAWCERFARCPAFAASRPPEWAVYRLQTSRERIDTR